MDVVFHVKKAFSLLCTIYAMDGETPFSSTIKSSIYVLLPSKALEVHYYGIVINQFKRYEVVFEKRLDE